MRFERRVKTPATPTAPLAPRAEGMPRYPERQGKNLGALGELRSFVMHPRAPGLSHVSAVVMQMF